MCDLHLRNVLSIRPYRCAGESKREDGAGEEQRHRANEFCVIAGFLVVIPVFTYNKYHARVYRREHPLIFGVQTVAFAGFFIWILYA